MPVCNMNFVLDIYPAFPVYQEVKPAHQTGIYDQIVLKKFEFFFSYERVAFGMLNYPFSYREW